MSVDLKAAVKFLRDLERGAQATARFQRSIGNEALARNSDRIAGFYGAGAQAVEDKAAIEEMMQ